MADDILSMLFKLDADPEDAAEKLEGFKGNIESVVASIVSGNTSIIASAEAMAASFGGMSLIAVGALGAITGALFELASNAAEVGAKIFEMSEATGISAEALSGLNVYTKETGESFDSAALTLSRFGKNIAEGILEPGSKAGKTLLDLMGGAQKVSELGLKPMDEQIQSVLQRIFALNKTTEQNIALTNLGGRGYLALRETLKLVAEEGFKPGIEAAKTLGLYFDRAGSISAKNMVTEMHLVKMELSSLGLLIGEQVMPQVMRFMEGWLAVIQRFHDEGFLGMIAEWGHGIVTSFVHPLNLAQEAMLRLVGKTREANQVALADAKMQMESADQWAGAIDKVHARVEALTIELEKENKKDLPQHAKAIKEVTDRLGELIEKKKAELAVMQEFTDHETRSIMNAYNSQIEAARRAMEEDLKSAEGQKNSKALIIATNEKYQQQIGLITQETNIKLVEYNKKLGEELVKEDQESAKVRMDIAIKFAEQVKKAEAVQLEGLKKVDEERVKQIKSMVAYGEELKKLDEQYLSMVGKVLTGEAKIRDEYQKTLEAFTIAQDKAMKLAEGDAAKQYEIMLRYEKLKEAALQKEEKDLNKLANSQGWKAVFGKEFADGISRNEELTEQWKESENRDILAVAVAVETLKEKLQDAFKAEATAMGASITQAEMYGKLTTKSMEEATAGILKGLSEQANAKGVMAVADAIVDAVTGNEAGAAAQAEAAVLYFSLGALAGVAAGALTPKSTTTSGYGGGGSSYGSGSGSRQPGYGTGIGVPLMAPGAQAQPVGGLSIVIVGEKAGTAIIANRLTNYVRQDGGMLVSSHTTRPAPAVRSGGG